MHYYEQEQVYVKVRLIAAVEIEPNSFGKDPFNVIIFTSPFTRYYLSSVPDLIET